MTHLKYYLFSIIIILIPTLSQTRRPSDYQKSIIIPKIYRVVESNNEITLEKAASQEFDKQGLLDFLQNNANLEYRVNNILNRQNEEKSGAKKRWIKRIVPHHEKSLDVIYDKATGTSFKPLVRIHKTKRIKPDNVRDIPRLEGIQDELKALRATFSAKKSRSSIPTIKTYTLEGKHLIQHLREVDAIVGQLETPYLKRKMLRTLEDYEKKIGPQVEMMHRDILNYLAGDNDIHALRQGVSKLEDPSVDEADWTSGEH